MARREPLTEEQIERELLWSQEAMLPEDEFKCRTCKKEKKLEHRSRENPERCLSCNGGD